MNARQTESLVGALLGAVFEGGKEGEQSSVEVSKDENSVDDGSKVDP